MSRHVVEEDDTDQETKPRYGRLLLNVAGGLIWCLLFVVVGVLGLFYLYILFTQKNGAMLECAIAGAFGVVFIGLYILARCAEKGLAVLSKLLRW
jgi:hypothetical protein